MQVNSNDDLDHLELCIRSFMLRHPLDRVLLGLRKLEGRYPPHVLAGAASFAMRYGVAGLGFRGMDGPLSERQLRPVMALVGDYVHADPVAFDKRVASGLLPIILRHVGNQFPFAVRPWGQQVRMEILFGELTAELEGAKGIPPFDFKARFQEVTGVSVPQFLDVGFTAYAASKSTDHLGFSRGYFEKARREGMSIPDDDGVQRVLSLLSADPKEFNRSFERYKQQDRTYRAYDYNPVLVYPILRPGRTPRDGRWTWTGWWRPCRS